jgi:hypothetical protein
MNNFELLNQTGALITTALGFMGLVAPNMASKFTGLTANNRTAFAEFRATFGGLFVVMGLYPLLSGMSIAFAIVGCMWIGTAFGRLLSVVFDRGYTEPKNFVGVAFEAGVGILMLAGNTALVTSKVW